jgi:hypothetical protein
MAWISVHQAVWTHRKTYALADLLALDETYAAAHVIRLWTWALDNSAEGGGIGNSARVIARAAGWPGDPVLFLEALVGCGWLDETEDGYVIHDWEEYGGKLVEKRRSEADRLRKWRDEQRTDDTRTKVVGETRTKRVRNATREEKTREEKTREEESPTDSLERAPLSVSVQSFDRAMRSARGYRSGTALLVKLQEKYGSLDLEEEALKMCGWLETSKGRRSTASTQFVLNWLGKALEDRAAAPPPLPFLPATNGAHHPAPVPRLTEAQQFQRGVKHV